MWWHNAIYDTCALITLGHIFNCCKSFKKAFPKNIHLVSLPAPKTLASIVNNANLSRALSLVDTLVFATAAHYSIPLVTHARRMFQHAISHDVIPHAGTVTCVLKILLDSKLVTVSEIRTIFKHLSDKNECIFFGHKSSYPNTVQSLRGWTIPW